MTKNPQGVQTPAVFSFNSLSIRAITDEQGNPWFVAKDVCVILGHSRPGIAVKDHCRQDGTTKSCLIDNLGRRQETIFINEGNLYRLIIKSKKPEAEKFERQVMEEILPSIRKTGSYSGSQKQVTDKSAKQPKRYNYPRHLLEQEWFTSPSRHAPLNISMLGHEKEFSSTLLQLLLELRMDGHNVDAPYDEFIAMREGMIKARRALDEIMHTALRASGQPASTAVRS